MKIIVELKNYLLGSDNIVMSPKIPKNQMMLFFVILALLLNIFLFQNCSPALFRLQSGTSAHSVEDLSSFLNETESEIRETKEKFKTDEVILDNSDKVRNIASENERIKEVDAQMPKSNVKIRLKRKSKK